MADLDSDPPTRELEQPSAAMAIRALAPNLFINGVFPIVLYQVLTGRGVGQVSALVAGSVFPLAYSLWGWARTRQLDIIAAISLAFIIVSAAASLISGSPRFTLIKESVFTGIFGLVFFGSLFASRPLMFYIAQKFATGSDPRRLHLWKERWQYPSFRHSMRVMTAMWGVAFVADALTRTWLVFLLSTSVFLVASQVLFYGMFASTLAITMAYGRSAQRRAQAQRGVSANTATPSG
ncbi:MAG TPA: VC0807 family protein [Chloroflexota bacterium]|nr:VC0807 family protein [Chloroflexota bacterium]